MDEEDFVLAGLRALRVGVPPHGEEAILRRLHAAGFKAPKFEIPRGRIGAKASSEMRGGRVSVRRALLRSCSRLCRLQCRQSHGLKLLSMPSSRIIEHWSGNSSRPMNRRHS